MFKIGDLICTKNNKLVGVIVDIHQRTAVIDVMWNYPKFATGCKTYTTTFNNIQPLPKGTNVKLKLKTGNTLSLKYSNYDSERKILYGQNNEPLLLCNDDKLEFNFNDEDITTKNSKQYECLKIEPWCIMESDFTKEEFIGFLKGNIIKYCLRKKGSDLQDFEKIEHYAKKLQEVLKGE